MRRYKLLPEYLVVRRKHVAMLMKKTGTEQDTPYSDDISPFVIMAAEDEIVEILGVKFV